MRRRASRLWLIPAVIIGFNCLVFFIIVFFGMKKAEGNGNAGQGSVSSGQMYDETGTVTAASENRTDGAADPENKNELSDSFYDEEIPDEDIFAYSSGYVLLLTSSESDLQIQILKDDGSQASGIRWKANVSSDTDDYRFSMYDDDEDGLIYVEEVEADDYTVEVSDGKGITETAGIGVKPKIKYSASSGVRNIVLQESQIDAATEDTSINSEEKKEETVSADEGGTKEELPKGTLGIDVSKYNKTIDWNRVKASGVEFAIIRAGYRGSSSGVLVEDPYFRQNLVGAKEAGIKIGVYFFTQAINEAEAREEAEAVSSLVNVRDLSLPVFLDVESSGNSHGGRADSLDINTRTAVVKAFCETAEELGFKAGVYANKNWMTKYINMEALKPYTKWLAQYNVSGPTYTGDYSIWQYTSNGSVDGISGRVDMNIMVKE